MPARSPTARSGSDHQLAGGDARSRHGKTGGASWDGSPCSLSSWTADVLSVQVHPRDEQTDFIPAGESGKSEAWVVLETGPQARIYAGLKPGTTHNDLEQALVRKKVADLLSSFTPEVGDAVFVRRHRSLARRCRRL